MAKQLDGPTICVQLGAITELNLADDFRSNGTRFTLVVIEQVEQIRRAFISGRCDASCLASFCASQGSAVVRKGGRRFLDIVDWSQFATAAAEEPGITSANPNSFMGIANDCGVDHPPGRQHR